jgi:hypothetical protein
MASAPELGSREDKLLADHSNSAVRSAWGRFKTRVFSFPVMCFSLLTAMLFKFCLDRIADPDIWWHLRNVRFLFQYRSLPRVDMYSFGAAGSPWMNHEWLSEIPYYLAFHSFGLRGLLFVYFALVTLIYAAVYYRTCCAGADCKDATIVTWIAIAIGLVSIGPRTLLFGWLGMMVLLLVLDEFRRSGRGLWLLPPLFVIWINCHGSWVFGIVVLVVTIAAGLVEGDWGLVVTRRWSTAQLSSLLITVGVSIAALFLNPFGYRLVLYPFDLLFRQPANMKNITEWQPVDFSIGMGKLALAVTLALLAAAWFSHRRWRLDEVLLLSFALWFGLSHWRMMFFVGLLIPSILGPRFTLFTPYDSKLDKPWLNAVIMTVVVAGLIYFYPSEASLRQKVNETFPTAAIEFIQREQLKGRVFNSYGWGGYMEWTAPELKPFIDGRADIFVYNGTFDDYFNATFIKEPFEVLDKNKIDYVLEESTSPLSYLLDHSPAWHRIYDDPMAKLYKRVPATAVVGHDEQSDAH